MALRFVDSFDHYATADVLLKYNSSSGTPTISAGNGRRSTASFRSATAGVLIKTLDAQASWVVGFSFKVAALPTLGALVILSLRDAGTTQVDVRLNTDGTMSVTRNGTNLSTSASALSGATTYYVEFKATISDAAGSYTLRVNGGSFTTGSSVDTKNTANASANQIAVGAAGNQSQGNCDIDDLYVCDGTGSANNDFLGDVRVDCYMPSGNGNSSQLTGSDGNSTDNYALVDEASQNGDTDYVQSATSGQKDTYAFTDMSHTPASIFGVQVNMVAKKDDSGNRSICAVTRSGGADTDGATQALSTSYSVYTEIRETDPNTSAAWTRTNLNNAEFGVKVAA